MAQPPLDAEWVGVERVQAVLSLIERDKLNVAKKELRAGAKEIAQEVLIPALMREAETSGVPIAPIMAATARAKSDRIVTVRIGSVNPKLSNWRSKGTGKPRGAKSKSRRTTLAYGSDRGPHPSSKANYYATSRDKSHYVQPTVDANATWQEVVARYRALLNRLLSDYGKY